MSKIIDFLKDSIMNESTVNESTVNESNTVDSVDTCPDEQKTKNRKRHGTTQNDLVLNDKKHRIPEVSFDMYYLNDTAKLFLLMYSNKNKDFLNLNDTDLHDLLCDTLRDVVINNKWINDKTTKIFATKIYNTGDIINLTYTPNSQKYIEYYDAYTCTGRVIFIDNKNDNLFIVVDTDTGYIIKTLEREGCHYFGMTRGYGYLITSE